MKKNVLYLVFFILFPITISTAQNTTVVGEITAMDMFLIGIEKTNDSYTLTYKDQYSKDFNALRNFTFKDNNFENLYSTIIKGFDTLPADSKMDFSGATIVLHFEKQSGGNVMFRFVEMDKGSKILGHSPFLTKNQVNTLFGKK